MPHGPWGWTFTKVGEIGAPTAGRTGVGGYFFGSAEFLVFTGQFAVHELAREGNTWSHSDLTLLSGAPSGTILPPVGYAFASQGTRHVIQVVDRAPQGAPRDLILVELWRGAAGWHSKNLTREAAAPVPSPLASPCAYVCDFDGTQHVVYVGEHGHIHELWWDADGWHHNDLTHASGSPAALGSSPAGYVSAGEQIQHVSFVGHQGQLRGMRWSRGVWSRADPDVPGGLVPAFETLSSSPPVGYVSADGTQRVTYLGQDNQIYEISFDGHHWRVEQASVGTPGLPGEDAALAAYPDETQGTRHIAVAGAERVHGFWRDAVGWHHTDLSAASGCPGTRAGSRMTGYALPDGRRQHVAYVDIHSNVILLEWRKRPDLRLPTPPSHPV
jgi:hypothetical protein